MWYNAKSLKINVVISGNVLLLKNIKISLGLLITTREMHALFWENHFRRCQQLQIMEQPSLLSNPKFQANLRALHPIK